MMIERFMMGNCSRPQKKIKKKMLPPLLLKLEIDETFWTKFSSLNQNWPKTKIFEIVENKKQGTCGGINSVGVLVHFSGCHSLPVSVSLSLSLSLSLSNSQNQNTSVAAIRYLTFFERYFKQKSSLQFVCLVVTLLKMPRFTYIL